MKKVQIFIFPTIATLLFFSCNQKDVIQNTNTSSTQSSALMENQNSEISALTHKINELETELQQRVEHLENYFDRRTPESVAKLYGEAVKTRNGALQYALFSKELKDKTYDYFVSANWHTGVSNPHITDFNVDNPVSSEDGQTVINIIFYHTVTEGAPIDTKCTLLLKQIQKEINDDWYITALTDMSG